jgi:hypothetical protein
MIPISITPLLIILLLASGCLKEFLWNLNPTFYDGIVVSQRSEQSQSSNQFGGSSKRELLRKC